MLSTVESNLAGLLVLSGANCSYYLFFFDHPTKIRISKVVASVGEAVFSAWEKVVACNCIKAYFPGVWSS